MKKFWQHLIVWQKATISLFVFLSLVFVIVFLNSKQPSCTQHVRIPFINNKNKDWSICEKDTDCEARFSLCSCDYFCVNKKERTEDCDRDCPPEKPRIPAKCVCSNGKCVEESDCVKIEAEINNLINQIKYCEKDSDCEYDEEYNDIIWPFDCYLIKSKMFGENYKKLLENKSKEFLENDCPYGLRECPYYPKQEDLACRQNQCVDLRFYQETSDQVERLNTLKKQNALEMEDLDFEVANNCNNLDSIESCEKIEWPLTCGCKTADKHVCYECFAALEKNVSYCEKIEEDFWKTNCYWGVVVQMQKAGLEEFIDFCDKMPGEAKWDNQKGACFDIMNK